MNKYTFKNKKVLQQYVAWLYETFPDVPKSDIIEALDNQEKRDLEDSTSSVGNLFFEWFELRYPHIWKISTSQKEILLTMYRTEISDQEHNDPRYNNRNFDNNLSHKYKKKQVKL